MTWRRRCRERWSDREKERSHSVQRKGLIPVCLRKCRVSSSERAKRQVQPSHVQWYGFSPAHTQQPPMKHFDDTYNSSGSARVSPWTFAAHPVNVGCVSGAPTCVYPPVGFEVGALGVNFFAAFVIAHVDPPPLQVQRIGVDGLQVHPRPETHTGGGSVTASQPERPEFSCFRSSVHF